MTAPHSLYPAQLLDNALSGASPDLMRHRLTTVINALLSAEADAVCGGESPVMIPRYALRLKSSSVIPSACPSGHWRTSIL
jgi:hypothetical protein